MNEKVGYLYELLKRKGFIVDSTTFDGDVYRIPYGMMCISKDVEPGIKSSDDKYIIYAYAAVDPNKEVLVLCRTSMYEYYSDILNDIVHKPMRHISVEVEHLDEIENLNITALDTLNGVSSDIISRIEKLPD